MNPIRYEDAGVRYSALDAFKVACQREAAGTVGALGSHGLSEPRGIRGESAYLLESDDEFLAHVEEGLGTKNIVADAMFELTEKSYYANIGLDTVATIVNDLITTGAVPISIAMHAAVGDTSWFDNQRRAADLARGFAEGCRQANAVWGGGETPALKGVVDPARLVLAGSAVGRIKPKSQRIVGDVRAGDAIIFLASSGVHTNGLTLCRAVAEQLSDGYLTPLDDLRVFGEALLDPSIIYVRFIAACQQANLRPHYAAHVTGHGWRKLMRLDEPFVYEITDLRPPRPIFEFIAQNGPVEMREMYATFNMGAGFAIYVHAPDADRYLRIAKDCGYDTWLAGRVRKDGSRKAVEIPALAITFEAETLQLR